MEVYTIPLTQGKHALVSAEDADLVEYKWSFFPAGTGYAARYIGPHATRRPTLLHRIILARILGRPLVTGEEVDHKDGNSLNNTRNNLRLVTHRQNMQNRALHKNNTSGYKGVRWNARENRWRAFITVDGREIYLGRFHTAEEAAAAYQRAAIQYFGEMVRE